MQRVPNAGKFHCNVKDLSIALRNSAEVHSFITIENTSSAVERLVVAIIYSELLLKAVDIRKIASDSTRAALSDAFHVILRVIEIFRARYPRISPLPRIPVPQNIVLPE